MLRFEFVCAAGDADQLHKQAEKLDVGFVAVASRAVVHGLTKDCFEKRHDEDEPDQNTTPDCCAMFFVEVFDPRLDGNEFLQNPFPFLS